MFRNPRYLPSCFVCDQRIVGERINLSSATAPLSKIGLPEKLSQLIGEEFVVVVTEQDLLCKRCASLLMHLDKLENELILVKKAIITYVKQKYGLPFPDSIILPTRKNNATSKGGERSTVLANIDSKAPEIRPVLPTTSVSSVPSPIGRKRAAAPRFKEPPPKIKPQQPAEFCVPKMKIFKCGFCSFQSKELHNVRIHMKLHVKAGANNKSDDDSSVSTQRTIIPAATIKRRLFRCQVCSASFEERTKCLDHISREHTSGGKKFTNIDDKKGGLSSNNDYRAKSTNSDLNSLDSSSSLDRKSDITQSADDSFSSAGTSMQFYGQDTDADSKGIPDNFSSDSNSTAAVAAEVSVATSIISAAFAATDKVDKDDKTSDKRFVLVPSTNSIDSNSAAKKDCLLKKIITLDKDGPAFVEIPNKSVKELSMSDSIDKLPIMDGLKSTVVSDDSGVKSNSTVSDDIRDEKGSDKKAKKVHSIDIEAMIAALHSDGPTD